MTDPITNLAALNIVTQPTRANIFEIIAKKKHVTFKQLLDETGLTPDALSKHLNKLCQYSLINVDVTKSKGDQYAFYSLTEQGGEFHELLHDILVTLTNIHPPQISEKFVIDYRSFTKIYETLNVERIYKLFQGCIIVFTPTTFSKLLELVEDNKDDVLEDFLFDERKIIVAKTYEDIDHAIAYEYYLRRAKKLTPADARLVATAKDLNASIISDNNSIVSAAQTIGILCAKVDAVLAVDPNSSLLGQFHELTLGLERPNAEFLTRQTYNEILKKK